jgi:molybdopterin-containing oxidoreductase family iron-sulfur binding subunit
MSHCPYQVRRFNYLSHEPLVVKNPAVAERPRGVVEKCTFCFHRLEAGETATACQQACPTGAIAFGSLADASSEVSQWHRSDRRYALLNELGTRPRTVYLARAKNPNPELA